MYNRKHARGRIWCLLVLVCASFIACERDHEMNNETALWHIVESEKLVVPAQVAIPVSEGKQPVRVATYYATGVQKYRAQEKPGSDPATYEWVLAGPRADLFDVTNAKVGTHTAGPAWQLLGGADSIFAQAFSPAKAVPSPDANSVDWLLLKPKEGKAPTGIFAEVDFIQRIATKGGKAPSRAPKNASETAEVEYTAVYRFTKAD